MEVTLGVSDDLSIGRMIDGFNADDLLLDIMRMLMNVADKILLGISRADDQDLLGVTERTDDLTQERRIERVLARADAVRLVMNVVMRMRQMNP